MIPIFSTKKRYTVLYGGRGSAKSHSVATFLLLEGMKKKTRILCCREIQNSIKDSIHRLLSDKINLYNFDTFYRVTQDSIEGINGTNFIFKGLYRNSNSIKSTEGIDICHVEEAQSISRESFDILTPTIRKENSRLIFTMNPTTNNDIILTDFINQDRDDTLKIQINYNDNPFFPDVLKQEMEWCRKTDADRFNHIWLGHPVQHSEAQIFYGKWVIDNFDTPADAQFYFGADWGFSQDPTFLVRSFVKDNILYIDYEAHGIGVDIDKTPDLFKTVPQSETWQIIADSARPETISYMAQRGFKITRSRKGKGSVIDGIAKLRAFEKIVVHSRCKNMIDEFRLYSYKIDKMTGKPTPVPEDKHNHGIDALRYAIENIGEQAIIRRW